MKRLLGLIMAVALVSGMLGIGTAAYFSDTVVSSNNVFSSGDLVFNIKEPGGSDHQVFNVTGLYPGKSVKGYIAVANDSTPGTNMKWRAWIDGWDSGILDDVLDVKVTLHPSAYGWEKYESWKSAGYTIAGPTDMVITSGTWIGNLAAGNSILVWQSPAEPFAPKWLAVYEIEVTMRASADNRYENQGFTGSINFLATQFENPGW